MARLTRIAPLAACAATFLTSLSAQAGLLPTSVTVTPEAGNYRWTYAIVLPTDSQLQTGNYFTIYDFKGYIPASASAPAGWSFTVQNTGPTPDRVNPDDNPNIPNLSWTYTGPTLAAGQTGLGNFTAVSPFEMKVDSFFTAKTNRTSDGKVDTNITTTSVPVPGEGPVGVPEPATLALAGMGLPVLLGRWLRRRKAN